MPADDATKSGTVTVKTGQTAAGAPTMTMESTDRGIKAEMGLPDTVYGNLARIYIAVGLVGTLVIVFLGMIGWQMKQSVDSVYAVQELMAGQVENLRADLKQARTDAREDQREMVNRYITNRELTEKRHMEVLAKLDKVVIFVEQTLQWFMKESHKAPGEMRAAPPKPDR